MPEAIAVEPLRCAGCGALLALGRGKMARCLYCGADTPIPAAYDMLQRAAQSFADDRSLAAKLYGRVGKPPGKFAQAIGRGAEGSARLGGLVGGTLLWIAVENGFVGIPLVMAAAYALGFPVAGLIRAAYWVGRLPAPKELSPYMVLAWTTLAVVLLIALPAIVFRKERALDSVRRDIHASLAAALPERDGGPSLCRNCGAALDIPQGARGVPCSYCRADNLVALPKEWVSRVRATEFKQFLQIDGALESFRLASEVATQRMWTLALAMLFVFPLVMGLAWFLTAARISF